MIIRILKGPCWWGSGLDAKETGVFPGLFIVHREVEDALALAQIGGNVLLIGSGYILAAAPNQVRPTGDVSEYRQSDPEPVPAVEGLTAENQKHQGGPWSEDEPDPFEDERGITPGVVPGGSAHNPPEDHCSSWSEKGHENEKTAHLVTLRGPNAGLSFDLQKSSPENQESENPEASSTRVLL